jgi:hypothetical protein
LIKAFATPTRMLAISPTDDEVFRWREFVLPPQNARSAMDRYIHEQNLAHYRKVLSETTDPAKRQTLLKLLADEQARSRIAESAAP